MGAKLNIDPDRRVMEIARWLEKPLSNLVSHEIKLMDAEVSHATPDGMTVSICYTPTDGAHAWRLVFEQNGKWLVHHVSGYREYQSVLEHAIRVIPELIGDIAKGRRSMGIHPLAIQPNLPLSTGGG